MIEIKVDVVIMNFFALGARSIRPDKLFHLCEEIERNIPHLYIHKDMDTLLHICQSNYHMFTMDTENTVFRGSWSDPEGYITYKIMTLSAPEEAQKKMTEILMAKLDDFQDYFLHIFTQEYVNEHFNYQVPENYRRKFLSIIKNAYGSQLISPE